MKKKLLLFFILFSSCVTRAQQRFIAGIKAGISTSQVAGDTYSGFHKAGIVGGVSLTAKLNEKWNAQFEMLFIQKGSKYVGDYNKGDYTFYLMKLNYLEVPLLVEYRQKKFGFEIGPGFSYLISGREEDYSGDITNALPFNKTEISLNIGISRVLYKNLGITWRYSNSVSSIRSFASGASRWYNPGERNNVLAFSLTYKFGSAVTE
jgi:hypothetical protein